MEIEVSRITRSPSGGLWYLGRIGAYRFEALVFAEPSRFGIDGGQVSKLWLLDMPRRKGGRELAAYDRGWDTRPAPEHAEVIALLVDELSRRERARYQTEEQGG